MHSKSALALITVFAVASAHVQALGQTRPDRSDVTIGRPLPRLPTDPGSGPRFRVELPAVAPSAGAAAAPVFVGAVTFEGLRDLSPADFADVISASVGRALSSTELAQLATAIAARMQAHGFPLAAARVDPQTIVNGILVVHVDEGRIDEIRLNGPDVPAAQRALSPLLGEQAIRVDELERRLMLAGDINGLRLGRVAFVREGNRGILLADVARDPASLTVSLTNEGTKPIGPQQLQVEANLNGLFASDDSLSLAYAGTPAEPRELQFGQVSYTKRISPSGAQLALLGLGSVTRPGSYLSALQLENRSWYSAVSVAQPLRRSRKASYWLQFELGLRNLMQWRGLIHTRDDRLTTARLTLNGFRNLGGGRLRVSTSVTQGLKLFGATQRGDALSSRVDADGTFTTATIWADWTAGLGERFSLRLAAQGQLASQPLLVSEQVSLGGSAFLRGYDWGERSGDKGYMGLAELRWLLHKPLGLVNSAQVYAFADGGKVWNLSRGYGAGGLASAGAGVRLDVGGGMSAGVELALPLSTIRYDTGNRTPKVNVNVSRSF